MLTPGYSFTATLDDAPTGQTGTLTYELVRISDSSVVIAAATTGIVEAAPGVYIATRTLPVGTAAGECLHVWTLAGTSTTEPVTVGPPLTALDHTLGAGYHLALGPLRFITAYNTLKEVLGDGYDAVGAAIVATDPKPRPFDLSIPVRGDAVDVDPVATGNMLRRQVRALLENTDAKAGGLYFRFAADPELNGWLMVGGGDLEYGDGGPTFAEYKLTLTDCYLVGRQWTHRRAVRAELLDRRLATSPRDYRRTIYSTDFAAFTGTSRLVLPVDATDVETGGALVATTSLAGRDGNLSAVSPVVDSRVYSFEQPEASIGLGDVAIWDRGVTPAVETSWVQVFGAAQPLTAGDIPVLDNGRCRTRLVGATVAVDAWTAGAWAEQARLTLPAPLISAQVVFWSAERAAVTGVCASGANRFQWYLTLERGWSGPRLEVYAPAAVAPTIRVVSFFAGVVNLTRSDVAATAITDTTGYGDFTARDPWAYLLPADAAALGVGVSVLRTGVTMTGRDDTTTYPASTRKALDFATAIGASYVSVALSTDTHGGGTAGTVTAANRNLMQSRAAPTLILRG